MVWNGPNSILDWIFNNTTSNKPMNSLTRYDKIFFFSDRGNSHTNDCYAVPNFVNSHTYDFNVVPRGSICKQM